MKHKENDLFIVSLYVDDLLITGSNIKLIDEFKGEIMKIFKMTDLGLMTYFLGMEIKQEDNEVFICQRKYAKEILKKFHMEDCKAMTTPMNPNESLSKDDGAEKVEEGYFRSMIGCLMYLTTTRPNILFAASILSQFMHCANEIHLETTKKVIRYIKGTTTFSIKFKKCQNFKLLGFSISD
ncbi:Retrovirus-related polyprotein from transposon [Salix suchowensis]|nr:Retrovirus-related polyprotein from transposon [Salix suchowensis]